MDSWCGADSGVDDPERASLLIQGLDGQAEIRATGVEPKDLVSTSCVVC